MPAAPAATSKSHGSVAETQGVRVAVVPAFAPEQSDPTGRKFVFVYRVRITNNSAAPVKLLRRCWRIVDAHGGEHEVRGDGVVGQQPRLEPGASFEYASSCPLKTPWGTMEGAYTFKREDESTFDAEIKRFYLVGPEGKRR